MDFQNSSKLCWNKNPNFLIVLPILLKSWDGKKCGMRHLSTPQDLSKIFIWHTDLLYELNSYKLQVEYLTVFCLFSVIDGFEWLKIKSFQKNIQ